MTTPANTRIINLLNRMDSENASDIFVSVGKPPAMRVYGEVKSMDAETVTDEDLDAFFAACLPPAIPELIEQRRDLDIGISPSETERFRLNLYYQKGRLSFVARRVPSGALDLTQLRHADTIARIAQSPRGLILITGATGSGKSTTMAAVLHYINSTYSKHIVTIEDPIEFIHQDLKSVVTQREIGSDTLTFADSLRYVVRQNPDAIFIGELRDIETIQTAISAAMTGHLVVTTMHTVDVSQTLERIINYFPDHLRDQIAMDFSMALRGIIAQRLLPKSTGDGAVVAMEILMATPLIQRLISRRELGDIEEAVKAGSGDGMQTFNRDLSALFEAGAITMEIGAAAATNRDEFLLAIQGMETGIDTLRRQGADDAESKQVDMRKLLKAAIKHKASDILITTGSAPILRIDGVLNELNLEPLKPIDTHKLLFSVLAPAQRAQFEQEKEVDFALSVSNLDRVQAAEEMKNFRFRVNGFYQKGAVSCALRVVPQSIPSAAALGIPAVILELANRHHGMILVTGPTGHGKSTTLACIIDEINQSRSCHIITIEDPIEYVHKSKKAVIEQREVHADTRSFTNALKYILRQDPDVILIGEMRDQETISAALTAAETGHLVLATLHTNDASQTIDRIIDTFPPHQQNQIRSMLSAALIGVVAQRLVPRTDEDGRVAVFEVMLGTPAIQALIRDNRTHQLQSTIETSAKDGMITMDKALKNLYSENKISRQTVKSLARDPDLI